MSKTYNLPNGIFTDIDGTTEVFTHVSGLQMLLNPTGELVIIHPSDLIFIANHLTRVVRVHNSLGELLETLELTDDFKIEFDGMVIQPCNYLP